MRKLADGWIHNSYGMEPGWDSYQRQTDNAVPWYDISNAARRPVTNKSLSKSPSFKSSSKSSSLSHDTKSRRPFQVIMSPLFCLLRLAQSPLSRSRAIAHRMSEEFVDSWCRVKGSVPGDAPFSARPASSSSDTSMPLSSTGPSGGPK